MRSSQALHEQITDAISRGRLCVAEGCGFSRSELDALCELGAEKLEIGLVEEAVTVLRGLVALYPFSSKYYLCLGIALIRAGKNRAAATALKLASTLCPADLTIRVSHTEALLKAGLLQEAKKTFDGIPSSANLAEPSLHRFEVIKACIEHLKPDDRLPAPVATPKPAVTPSTTFKLPNGTALPLKNSRYEVTQPMVSRPEVEPTQTQTPLMTFDESITITAVVRRRLPEAASSAESRDVTQTAVVIRRKMGAATSKPNEDTALSYFPEIDRGD